MPRQYLSNPILIYKNKGTKIEYDTLYRLTIVKCIRTFMVTLHLKKEKPTVRGIC